MFESIQCVTATLLSQALIFERTSPEFIAVAGPLDSPVHDVT